MCREEISRSIKTVFSKLYKIIGLYEETECYNCVPGDKSQDIWEYMENQFFAVREIVATLLLGEKEVAEKLNAIINETEYFVKKCERPGTVLRWKQINPNLLYFDSAFDLMEELDEEAYLSIQRGLTDIRLALYPDEKLIKERKVYFDKINRDNEDNNLRYSEERIFQNEMINTLVLVFENDFEEYLR